MPRVYQRRDGRYAATYRHQGKSKTLYGGTAGAVETQLRELQAGTARAGVLAQPGRRTVDDLVAEWLGAAVGLRPSSMEAYRKNYALYVQPALGRMRLSQLEPVHIQRLYTALQERGLKRAPAYAHSIVHRSLKMALLWGWVAYNAAERVIVPQHRAERPGMWAGGQTERFLAVCESDWKGPAYMLILAAGLRLGELRGLRWEHYRAGSLRVECNLVRVGKEQVEGRPKTAAGERTVVLPAFGVEALERQQAQQAQWQLRLGAGWPTGSWIFTARRGGALSATTLQHGLPVLCERAGVPALTPHQLRHMHASILLDQGIPLPAVSARLGHATAGVTANIYAHRLPGRDRVAAEAMQRALCRQAE